MTRIKDTPRRLAVIPATFAIALALGACASLTPSTSPPNGPTATTSAHNATTTTGAALGAMSLSEGLSLGQTVSTPNPSVTLTKPVEDSLSGYQFSVRVLGYAEAPYVSSDFGAYSASPGDTIAVVSYDLEYEGTDGGNADLAVVAGGQRFPIADSDLQGNWTVGVAVPKSTEVALTATEVGLTQVLSFTTGTRVGAVPPELYRSPAGPDITVPYDTTVSLNVIDRDNPQFRAVDQLTLNSVVLTYFSPVDPSIQPASVNGAFLVVNASEQTGPTSQGGLGWKAAMPPSRMRLILPNGRVIEADPNSDTNTDQPATLLDGNYYFDVPATFTTGTIEIAPGTGPATEYGPEEGFGNLEDTVLGTAAFRIAFPPPPKVVPVRPRPARTVRAKPRAIPPTTVANVRSVLRPAKPAKHSTFPIPLPYFAFAFAVVLLGLLLAGVLLPNYRRRRLAPFAVDAEGRHVDPPTLLRKPPGPVTISDTAEHKSENTAVPVEAAVTGNTAVAPDAPDAPTLAVHEDAAGEREPEDEGSGEERISVRVLGPVEVFGLISKPKRRSAIELLCFLACHPDQRFTADEIREKLWPASDDGEQVSAETFRTYVSALRAAVGKDVFPEACGGTYGLGPYVVTDWDWFRAMVSFAEGRPPAEATVVLCGAFSYVRGPLFSGVPKDRYQWIFECGLLSQIEVAIIKAASMLAELCMAAETPETALEGLAKALLTTKDLGVADDLLTAADATGNPATLDRAWRDVKGALGEDAERLRASYAAHRR